MAKNIIPVGESFTNYRGVFRLFLINVGTHSSLVKLSTGKFVLLDVIDYTSSQWEDILKKTNQGKNLEAVIHLHPFHTVYISKSLSILPTHVKHYGTARHARLFPNISFQGTLSQDTTQWPYPQDLQFSVPKGLELIPDNESVHSSSILAYHPHSGSIHVDDTFSNRIIGFLGKTPLVVHMMYKKALLGSSDAPYQFYKWGMDLSSQWGAAKNIFVAHNSANLNVNVKEWIASAMQEEFSTLNSIYKKRNGNLDMPSTN